MPQFNDTPSQPMDTASIELQYKLCYFSGTINAGIAFFAEKIEAVRGDDWDDAPYWCNASGPYSEEPVLKVGFSASGLYTPEEANVCVSIDDLIRQDYPFLSVTLGGCRMGIRHNNAGEQLYLGATLKEFYEFLYKHDGEVFIPLSHLQLYRAITTQLENQP